MNQSERTTDPDYPLSPVPETARKSMWSMSFVLLGFTFFSATMWAGGSVGAAFDFSTTLWVLLIGNLLLGAYAAILGYIAARSGLNTALMSRYAFGEIGRKLSENRPRRFQKPNPASMYCQLPPRSIAKMIGAGGLRAAN